MQFIAEQPGKTSKRDIATAFQVKGADRIPLKRLLREMAAEGMLEGGRKTGLREAGELPNVGVITITGRDRENSLLARAVRQGRTLDADTDPHISIDESVNERIDESVNERTDKKPPHNRHHRTSRTRRIVAVIPGDTALARLRRIRDGFYTARIIRKLSEAGGQVIGVLRQRGDGFWIVPANRRERYDYKVQAHDNLGDSINDGELVIAEKLPARRMGARYARIRSTLGSADAPNAFSLLSIAEQGIDTIFPDEVLAEADKARPITDTITTRHGDDLTGIAFITIDPADARDHDDAVFAEPDPDPQNKGGFIVWVAIADVATYVTSTTAMDREARKRGNSVYMPDRVIPMLPENLSTDLCSLKQGELRPCLAVRMVIKADGRKTAHRFYRGIIRVAAQMSYQQAQAAFDGAVAPDFGPLDKAVLQPLWQAYQAMATARDQRGPLNIDKPEQCIELDPQGRISRIHTPPRLEAHRLIEEMMVTANVCAAETLEKHKMTLIYRIHDTPSRERVKALGDFVRPLGIKINFGQNVLPRMFNGILQQGNDKPHAASVTEAVLRTQAQAIYDTENIGHFGLNLGRYAHFTSPIRRYADLTVHRALITALKFGTDGQNDGQSATEAEQLPDIAEAISTTERRAMLAERTAADRYRAAYLSTRIGDTMRARISGVSRAGLFVRLDDSGADGLIPISRLGAERFYPDDGNMCLTGTTTGTTFRLGEEVEVKLEEAMPLKGGLLFSLQDGGNYSGRKPESGHSYRTRHGPLRRRPKTRGRPR